MAKNRAIARMIPVNQGSTVKVINMSQRKIVGRMKMAIFVLR